MNARSPLERDLAIWMVEVAGTRTPDFVDDLIEATVRTRQRPRWTFPATWPTGAGRPSTSNRDLTIVFVVGVLALALVGTLLLAGGLGLIRPSETRSPTPNATAATSAVPTLAPTSPPRTPPPGPVSGTFQGAGRLDTARSGHTAVLLRDGRVLVVGGWFEGSILGEAPPTEIYDPTTGVFTRIQPILYALNRANEAQEMNQAAFSATELADGRVLLAGGRIGAGSDSPQPVAEALLFDPVSGAVTPTGSMTVARTGHAAVRLLDGRVLVAGGIGLSEGGVEASLTSAELYDPATGRFSPTGPLWSDREYPMRDDFVVQGLPSGRVLFSGGGAFGAPDELYDPQLGAFLRIPVEVVEEDAVVLILTGDHVYRKNLRSGQVVDLTPQSADVVAAFGDYCRDLPGDCRQGMTMTRLADGRVLIAGGTIIILDPTKPSGWRSLAQAWAEVLDPVTLAVTATGQFVEPRTGHTATLLPDGRVLLIGGYVPGSVQTPSFIGSAEMFTPQG